MMVGSEIQCRYRNEDKLKPLSRGHFQFCHSVENVCKQNKLRAIVRPKKTRRKKRPTTKGKKKEKKPMNTQTKKERARRDEV